MKYSLAYINPLTCSDDNGRVLGYDNSHDYHHRHFAGTIEPMEFDNYESLSERFHAEVIDYGEKLPAEIRLTFEDPADLMRVLSAERIRVLHTVRLKPRPVSDLANILKRDRKSVSRDVKVLESFGLVKTHAQPNPGHGLMRIVEPLAAKYQLVATI